MLFAFYAAFVVAWAIPDDESNNANLILGGCESKDPLSRGSWLIADKAVPPFVRCIVRAFRKDQILEARFKYARVGTAEHPLTPDVLNSVKFLTPVQAYVHLGARWSLGFESPDSAINTAMQSTILGSLDWLIENGADPNECTYSGLVPLHIAAQLNRDDLFSKWVALGANPDIECTENWYSDMGTTPQEWRDRS